MSPGLTLISVTTSGHRRGNFDGGFVGFEFEDGLIGRDGVADLDENAGDVAAGDVFTQLWDFEFGHDGSYGTIAGFGLSGLTPRS